MSNTPVYTSPLGRLVYPKLNEPTQYQGKGDFFYETDLDVQGQAARDFEQMILDYAEDYAKRVGKRRIDTDSIIRVARTSKKDGNEEIPDTIRFHFKINNKETAKGYWDRKPAFFHPDGTAFEEEPQLAGGTLVQIAFTMYEWKATSNGLTLQPEGLIIHELVERKASRRVDRSFGGLFGNQPVGGRAATRAAEAAEGDGSDF